jgi:hypothetical protein
VYIVLSGGTNSKSKELAELTGVRVNGVAIGTFARGVIEDQINASDFYDNEAVIKQAFINAKQLVTSNIGDINE